MIYTTILFIFQFSADFNVKHVQNQMSRVLDCDLTIRHLTKQNVILTYMLIIRSKPNFLISLRYR